MADRLPLPRPDGVVRLYVNDGFRDVWTAPSMRAYSDDNLAAERITAAHWQALAEGNLKIAEMVTKENAALRAANTDLNNALMAESLSAEGLADAQAHLMTEVKGLRADNTRLQNEVVGPLRKRVKVLEDALGLALAELDEQPIWSVSVHVLKAARAALGDNDADPR